MSKKKIIVFGRGAFFREKYSNFLENYDIEAFIDNAVLDKQTDILTGISVYNPKEILKLPEYDIFCVSNYWFQMWRQLIDLDVKDERIKFGVTIPPYQEGIEKIAFGDGEKIISENRKVYYISDLLGKREITSEEGIKEIVRQIVERKNESIGAFKMLSRKPISRVFGSERGKAVDRFYIEKFLSENADCIKGVVLEVLNNNYTLKYGGNKVKESVISHVRGWGKNTVLCNFETGEGVRNERYDCIICTQTLQYIYDLKAAITNIYGMLKNGGTALITVPGIKPLCEYDNHNWGEYWSFTENSIKRICNEVCDEGNIEISQYGNVKISTAYLYGVCVEELSESDFDYVDPQYPFLICAKIVKG